MQLIDRVRRVVTRALPTKLARSRLTRPLASFTFDDFPKCAWTVGGPILGAHGARGTYYVTGSRCGTVTDGAEQYDERDLGELHAKGHEIACHTFAHRPVPSLTNDALTADIAENAAFLRAVVGSDLELPSFAYPHGDVDPRTKLLFGRLFRSSRGIQSGVNAGLLDLSLLRVSPLHDLAQRPELLDALIQTAVARTGWIIFLTHDVQERPLEYGCTPKLLDRTIAAVRAAGIDVLPVKEALAEATGEPVRMSA